MYPMISSNKKTTNKWLFLGTHKKRMVGTRTCNKNRRTKIKPNPSHIPFTAPKPEPVGSQYPPENKRGTFKRVIFRFHVGNWNVLSNYAHAFQWNQVVVVGSTHCFQCFQIIQYLEHSQDDIFSVEVSTGQSVYPLGASFPWRARPMGKQEGNPRIMEI